jgi:hypothetical protein
MATAWRRLQAAAVVDAHLGRPHIGGRSACQVPTGKRSKTDATQVPRRLPTSSRPFSHSLFSVTARPPIRAPSLRLRRPANHRPGIVDYYTLSPQEKQAQKPATRSDSSKKSVREWLRPPRASGVRPLATAFFLLGTSPCRKREAIAGGGENPVWYGTPCRDRARTLRCRHPLPGLSGSDNLPSGVSRHGVPCHAEAAYGLPAVIQT